MLLKLKEIRAKAVKDLTGVPATSISTDQIQQQPGLEDGEIHDSAMANGDQGEEEQEFQDAEMQQ
jgi:hypothetical protein